MTVKDLCEVFASDTVFKVYTESVGEHLMTGTAEEIEDENNLVLTDWWRKWWNSYDVSLTYAEDYNVIVVYIDK